ncbi:MAG: fumarylacetoacetate hydrolase family protein [Pseudomonadota bacterium]
MLTERVRQEIVGNIEAVYKGGEPLIPLTRSYADITLEDSYEIQKSFVENRLREGADLRGYKVGLTSKAMQAFAGTDEPDYGALLDYMFIHEGSEIPAERWFDPLVEIEIAFVLKDRLAGGSVTPVDVIRATDFLLPAIELVDFRLQRALGINCIDTVADLAAVGAVIVGANPVRLEDIDVRAIEGRLLKNGESVANGSAAEVLGNPVNAVAWLANKLNAFGVTFEPGHLILTGSFVRAEPVVAGDDIVARFDDPFGDIRISFV